MPLLYFRGSHFQTISGKEGLQNQALAESHRDEITEYQKRRLPTRDEGHREQSKSIRGCQGGGLSEPENMVGQTHLGSFTPASNYEHSGLYL